MPTHRARALSLTLVLLFVLLVRVAALPAHAGETGPRARLLVDPAWLAAHLEDPGLVVLCVGEEEAFAAGHIEGSRRVSFDQIEAPAAGEDPLDLELPAPEALARALGELGVGDDSRIVVVFYGRWITAATRLLLTLDWIGLGDRSSLLDGGFGRWEEEGYPVTDGIAEAVAATLTPRPRADVVVDAAWVQAHRGDEDICLVDARQPAAYDGVQATRRHDREVRRGHIPGAASLPYSSIVDEQLRIRSADELAGLFAEAGYGGGEMLVAYCHIGQWATLVVFAARTLGHPARLYDGSFQDWGAREDLPVELPAESAAEAGR